MAPTRRRARAHEAAAAPSTAAARFRATDRYRAEREWTRYEGTPQRELWRTLRGRFLARHAVPSRWSLDLGSGPGRFTRTIGAPPSCPVAVDVSLEMLRAARRHWVDGPPGPRPQVLRADGLAPPFPDAAFGTVALLGNTLGFAGASHDRLLANARGLVAPEGLLILEIAPGPGERSRYLARLPPTSVARLLRSPVRAVVPRVEREGYDRIPERRSDAGEFYRVGPGGLGRSLADAGWAVEECLAVSPAVGPLASVVAAVRTDEKAWDHLIELEEALGRRPEHWDDAAAVLLAARAPVAAPLQTLTIK